MKKVLMILVLGLLINNNAYSNHLKIKLKDENRIVIQQKFVNNHEWPMSEAHCAQYKKFNWYVGLTEEHGSGWSLWICSAEKIYTYKGKHINEHQDADKRYSPNHPWVLAATNKNSTSSSSTSDKITQSKKICKELGFKANSEKFADCALKMMAMQFETGNKVSNSDGSSTQKIIVKQQDNFDIGDFFFGLQKIVDDNYRTTNNNSSNQGTNCRIVPKAWGADMVCR